MREREQHVVLRSLIQQNIAGAHAFAAGPDAARSVEVMMGASICVENRTTMCRPTAPPSLPATQRGAGKAAQLAQPDDEQIMQAAAAGVPGILAPYIAMPIVHRPRLHTVHISLRPMGVLLAGIASHLQLQLKCALRRTALHRDAGVQPSQPGTTRPRTQAQVFTPARPRPVKPARPAALRGGHLQG
ncbi:hypothetical protein Q7P35_001160 [Cladosporium inversicolor]